MTEMVDISGRAQFKIYGDVNSILNGEVDPDNTPQLALNTIPYALGAGRFTNPKFFGETFVLNHIAWGTTVSDAGEVLTEKKEQKLDSPFLLSIDIEREPQALKTYTSLSVIEIFSELSQNFKLGFAFFADARFGVFEGAYLKRSPIYHESVNVHHSQYWEHCAPLEDVHAFLFGIVLTDEGKKALPHFERGFYHNPAEQSHSTFTSHTHAALCERHALPISYADLQQLSISTAISGVRHFLAQSVIKEGVFALFDLSL